MPISCMFRVWHTVRLHTILIMILGCPPTNGHCYGIHHDGEHNNCSDNDQATSSSPHAWWWWLGWWWYWLRIDISAIIVVGFELGYTRTSGDASIATHDAIYDDDSCHQCDNHGSGECSGHLIAFIIAPFTSPTYTCSCTRAGCCHSRYTTLTTVSTPTMIVRALDVDSMNEGMKVCARTVSWQLLEEWSTWCSSLWMGTHQQWQCCHCHVYLQKSQ